MAAFKWPGAAEAQGRATTASTSLELYRALAAPDVLEVLILSDITIQNTDWAVPLTLQANKTIRAAPLDPPPVADLYHALPPPTRPLLDFQMLHSRLLLAPGVALTLQSLAITNLVSDEGLALLFVDASPGAAIIWRGSVWLREVSIPLEYMLQQARQTQRPTPPGGAQDVRMLSNASVCYTSPSEAQPRCHNGSCLYFADWQALLPVEGLPQGVNRSAAAARALLEDAAGIGSAAAAGGVPQLGPPASTAYLHVIEDTHYFVRVTVNESCYSVMPVADCITQARKRLDASEGADDKLLQLGTQGQQSEQQHSGLETSTIVLASVIPGCALLAGLGCLLALYLQRRWHGAHRTIGAGVLAPSPGRLVTLLITDVAASTTLWETLPTKVMDEAMHLHHKLVRHLLARHAGYESATEGDSFIAAFHTPADAARFALQLQRQLLDVAWPLQLLEHPEACELWVKAPSAPEPAGGAADAPAAGQASAGASPGDAAMPSPNLRVVTLPHSSTLGSSQRRISQPGEACAPLQQPGLAHTMSGEADMMTRPSRPDDADDCEDNDPSAHGGRTNRGAGAQQGLSGWQRLRSLLRRSALRSGVLRAAGRSYSMLLRAQPGHGMLSRELTQCLDQDPGTPRTPLDASVGLVGRLSIWITGSTTAGTPTVARVDAAPAATAPGPAEGTWQQLLGLSRDGQPQSEEEDPEEEDGRVHTNTGTGTGTDGGNSSSRAGSFRGTKGMPPPPPGKLMAGAGTPTTALAIGLPRQRLQPSASGIPQYVARSPAVSGGGSGSGGGGGAARAEATAAVAAAAGPFSHCGIGRTWRMSFTGLHQHGCSVSFCSSRRRGSVPNTSSLAALAAASGPARSFDGGIRHCASATGMLHAGSGRNAPGSPGPAPPSPSVTFAAGAAHAVSRSSWLKLPTRASRDGGGGPTSPPGRPTSPIGGGQSPGEAAASQSWLPQGLSWKPTHAGSRLGPASGRGGAIGVAGHSGPLLVSSCASDVLRRVQPRESLDVQGELPRGGPEGSVSVTLAAPSAAHVQGGSYHHSYGGQRHQQLQPSLASPHPGAGGMQSPQRTSITASAAVPCSPGHSLSRSAGPGQLMRLSLSRDTPLGTLVSGSAGRGGIWMQSVTSLEAPWPASSRNHDTESAGRTTVEIREFHDGPNDDDGLLGPEGHGLEKALEFATGQGMAPEALALGAPPSAGGAQRSGGGGVYRQQAALAQLKAGGGGSNRSMRPSASLHATRSDLVVHWQDRAAAAAVRNRGGNLITLTGVPTALARTQAMAQREIAEWALGVPMPLQPALPGGTSLKSSLHAATAHSPNHLWHRPPRLVVPRDDSDAAPESAPGPAPVPSVASGLAAGTVASSPADPQQPSPHALSSATVAPGFSYTWRAVNLMSTGASGSAAASSMASRGPAAASVTPPPDAHVPEMAESGQLDWEARHTTAQPPVPLSAAQALAHRARAAFGVAAAARLAAAAEALAAAAVQEELQPAAASGKSPQHAGNEACIQPAAARHAAPSPSPTALPAFWPSSAAPNDSSISSLAGPAAMYAPHATAAVMRAHGAPQLPAAVPASPGALMGPARSIDSASLRHLPSAPAGAPYMARAPSDAIALAMRPPRTHAATHSGMMTVPSANFSSRPVTGAALPPGGPGLGASSAGRDHGGNRTSRPRTRSKDSTRTWAEYCRQACPPAEASASDDSHCEGLLLIMRGLRVRVGVHCSMTHEQECGVNAASGRRTYGGNLYSVAHAVADAAAGGMVLVTDSMFFHLSPLLPTLNTEEPSKDRRHQHQQQAPPQLIFCGVATAKGICGSGASTEPGAAGELAAAADGSSSYGHHNARALYQLLLSELTPRVGYMTPLRNLTLTQLGNVDAPTGYVAIAFMYIMDMGAMLAELGRPAVEAMIEVRAIAKRVLLECGGYVVEACESLVLAAFGSPLAAAVWGARTRQLLMWHPWSAELMDSQWFGELCRVVVPPGKGSGMPGAAAAAGGSSMHRSTLLPSMQAQQQQLRPRSDRGFGLLGHNRSGKNMAGIVTGFTASAGGGGYYGAPATGPGAVTCEPSLGLGSTRYTTGQLESLEALPGADSSIWSSGQLVQIGPQRPTTPHSPLGGWRGTSKDGTAASMGGPSRHYTSMVSLPTPRRASADLAGRPGGLQHSAGAGGGACDGHSSEVVLRGPRIRTGISYGAAVVSINSVTGRMTYRGKLMNRAARIAMAAADGQVLCSAEVRRRVLAALTTVHRRSSAPIALLGVATSAANVAAAGARPPGDANLTASRPPAAADGTFVGGGHVLHQRFPGALPAGWQLRLQHMGAYVLKGIPQPVDLYSCEAAETAGAGQAQGAIGLTAMAPATLEC